MRHTASKSLTAVWVWLVSLTCVLLAAFTTYAVLNGRETSLLEGGALGALWLVAICFTGVSLGTPAYIAVKEPNGDISFIWQYPHKRVRKTFKASEISSPSLLETTDSDGDSHFSAVVLLPDGARFVLADSVVATHSTSAKARNETRCRLACEQFAKMISGSTE